MRASMGSHAARRAGTRLLAAALSGILGVAILTPVLARPANAATPVLLADWQMNEATGAQVMVDGSGNGIDGAVGSAIQTGYVIDGGTGYHWDHTAPNQPPTKPERLVFVDDPRLNPGSRDYAITVRFRTTRSYGNMIQKGQSRTPGGYFKWEIPNGILMCLFRSRSQNGTLLGERSVKSPSWMPLNDGRWHTVRCEKTVDRVTMTIDNTIVVQSSRGTIGSISNTIPLTIAGKSNCDQIEVTCDYFAGEIDYIRIETGGTASSDVQPPTTPGTPTGTSNGFTSVDLSWPGSTDNVSTTVQYRIFRDGAFIASTASSASTVSYRDVGLTPGSTHTYSVIATDLAGNASPPSPPSEPITVLGAPAGYFVDDFSSGFANWNAVSGIVIDDGVGSPHAPSASVQAVNRAATATKILPQSLSTGCVSFDIRPTSVVSNQVLMRLRTANDGGLLRLYVDSNRFLRLRSDVSSAGSPVTSRLTLDAWQNIEVCGTVGSSGSWDLYHDGVPVLQSWVANTGTAPIGRVQLGDFNARTWSSHYDFVVVDAQPGLAAA